MIYLYTGTVGSSKSLHLARDVVCALQKGRNVIANFSFNDSIVKRNRGHFIRIDNKELLSSSILKYPKGVTPHDMEAYSALLGLINFAENFHRRNELGDFLENQTLLVIDEAQLIFNPRTWNRSDRLLWIEFFTMSRHYGYDIILATQNENKLDKQIRSLPEIVVVHRNFKNFGFLGRLCAFLCGGNLFMHIYNYNGMSKKDARIKSRWFIGRQYYKYYRSTQKYREVGIPGASAEG